MAVARRTPNFRPGLPQRVVLEQDHGLGVDGFVKRRPTTVAIELGAGDEKLSAAPTTRVEAGTILFEEFACPWTFGSCFAQHVKLLGGQSLAPLGVSPLGGVFCHAHY